MVIVIIAIQKPQLAKRVVGRERGHTPLLRSLMPADLFNPAPWGNRIEIERWLRIKLLLAAYAYEIASAPILTDTQFDELARLSNPTITTGKHDEWWRDNFTPYTGQWIYAFPDLTGIEARFNRLNSTEGELHRA